MKITFLIIAAFIITFLGILTLYSNTYLYSITSDNVGLFKDFNVDLSSAFSGQLFRLLISILFFVIMCNIPYHKLRDASYFLYGFIVVLLLLVLVLGKISLGAQRWLRLGWLNFQPSELAKLIIIIMLARYYSRKSIYDFSGSIERWSLLKGFVLPFLLCLAPMGLIIIQPDLGTGLIFLFVFLILGYTAGVRAKFLVIFIIICLVLAPIFFHMLAPYQRQRLLVFLNPNIDPLGAGYTVIQSKIAVGSGMLFGKGWLAGTQSQLKFLPEANTDFIFASFAEEKGFIGSLFLMSLFFLLITNIYRIGKNTTDNFAQLLCTGVLSLFAVQLSINLLMTMGFCPVVGLPLPFMSFGGTSLLVSYIALGIVVNIARSR